MSMCSPDAAQRNPGTCAALPRIPLALHPGYVFYVFGALE